MRNVKRQVLADALGLQTYTATAAVATDLFTATSHNYRVGDMVVFSTAGTIYGGITAGTVYFVIFASGNTFKVSAVDSGDSVDITAGAVGTNTVTRHDISKNMNVMDSRHVKIDIDTDGAGDANLTVKVVGSNSVDCPDFSAVQSKTNKYDFQQVVDAEDGSTVDGDTGFTVAGADMNRQVVLNSDGLSWVGVIVTAWSEGEVTVAATSYDNQ